MNNDRFKPYIILERSNKNCSRISKICDYLVNTEMSRQTNKKRQVITYPVENQMMKLEIFWK